MTIIDRFASFLLVGAAVLASTALHAQDFVSGSPQGFNSSGNAGGYSAPQGFAAPSVSTVGQVRNMPDESYAVMQGQFTRHIGRELYEFKGTDGETIVADLDDDANWSFIRPGIRFEIAGEVDRDAYGIKFEVHSAKPLVK